QQQHLPLANRETVELLGLRSHAVGRPTHILLDETTGDRWRQQRVAGCHGAYAVGELFWGDVLEEEPVGAGLECLIDVLVHVEGREHEDLRPPRLLAYRPGRLDAVHDRPA